MGPWKGESLHADQLWLVTALKNKIKTIDWDTARIDVMPFLAEPLKSSIKLWGETFFNDQVDKLGGV